jgi:hypothetical protein
MKISVGSRPGNNGAEPCRLCLGRSSLPVTAVLERRDEGTARAFEVRVLDGRRFIVRYLSGTDQWELVAVHERGMRLQVTRVATSPVLMPLLIALYRKGVEIATREIAHFAARRGAAARTRSTG